MAVPYHAKDAVVYLAPDGTTMASPLAQATEWTLDMNTDTVEVTAFGDTNKTYVQGLPDVQGTISGLVTDTEDKWFKAAASTAGVRIYLYWSKNMTSKYAYGTAWFRFSVSNTMTSAAEISGSFVAAGPWKIIGY
jgi:hypothetical protein